MKEYIKNRIDLASGRKKPKLVFKNANIINVFSHEIINGDVALDSGKIVGIGEYEGEEEIDLLGKYLSPGFIDAHLHIESSMVSPSQFARAIVPRGTTTIIADPHEIGNVCGMDGIKYILDSSEGIPLNVFVMLPSCVPVTSFETSGAVLNGDSLKELINHKRVLGLGELMDYPSVIAAREEIIKKLEVADGKIIDGHGPGIRGKELNAYAAAGVRTEHECSTVNEMLDRIRLGMYILIRQGTAAQNLNELIKGITRENSRRCLFCTDDKHPEDILKDGHIDNNLRMSVSGGIDPVTAIQMATINAAECYGLKGIGAIAPGYAADLVVLEDLKKFNVLAVYKDGELKAQNKRPLFNVKSYDHEKIINTVKINTLKSSSFKIGLSTSTANVIKLFPHSLVTRKVIREVDNKNGEFNYNENMDIVKLAVVERHNATGHIGLGLVEGFGLKGGAIASTIAHDSHNMIIMGSSDEDMALAANEAAKIGGGIVICADGRVLGRLSLPIAGLMSNEPIETVNEKLQEMLAAAYDRLNISRDYDPFMTLSFLALPVIPEIKLTDIGLFDVTSFKFINLDCTEI